MFPNVPDSLLDPSSKAGRGQGWRARKKGLGAGRERTDNTQAETKHKLLVRVSQTAKHIMGGPGQLIGASVKVYTGRYV